LRTFKASNDPSTDEMRTDSICAASSAARFEAASRLPVRPAIISVESEVASRTLAEMWV
jgi:hypothetical protein